jgi:hypothetical protein
LPAAPVDVPRRSTVPPGRHATGGGAAVPGGRSRLSEPRDRTRVSPAPPPRSRAANRPSRTHRTPPGPPRRLFSRAPPPPHRVGAPPGPNPRRPSTACDFAAGWHAQHGRGSRTIATPLPSSGRATLTCTL